MKNTPFSTLLSAIGILVMTTCLHAQTTLKEAFKNDFLIGVAINQKQFDNEDQRGDPIIKAQFNAISPENILKWESVHPEPDRYDFTEADRYVEFGEANHMTIVGHTLVWHNQTPKWVFQDTNGAPATREVLLERMRDHIHTVVGRYKGRIKIWDVVNEALQDNGTLRKSPWEKIIGDDYIEKAFQYAHEADPDAILRYNDYSLENTPKRNGAIALIKKLQAEGVPVTAIGLQDHVKMDWPTVEQEDATISDFAKLGLKVMITELDVNVLGGARTAEITEMANQAGSNAYANGLPPAVQQALAKRYADLFTVFVKHHDDISLVTFWGVTDGDSWLNMRGRINHPLLFDRAGQPKPAFDAVIQVAQQANAK
ncbi:MAG TPA: endo-1,4-beta-xylanase [Candidatus Sulfopaludibacter sp.]|nr:endo-1,4-beta-xylanase [Candidatus Sulfopaludibacter sp.]